MRIKQARYMAKDEMKTITSDKWSQDVWESVLTKTSSPPSSSNRTAQTKLYFLFGRDDDWVSNDTRDELIKVRGQIRKYENTDEKSMRYEVKKGDESADKSKAIMEIDESGIPHGFCLSM